jgi:hypothetical protein
MTDLGKESQRGIKEVNGTSHPHLDPSAKLRTGLLPVEGEESVRPAITHITPDARRFGRSRLKY